MAQFNSNRFGSQSVEWATPESIYRPLDAEFSFTCDLAATSANAKCAKFFTKEDNSLLQSWEGVCWLNPPYGRDLPKWLLKAENSALSGNTVVCLIPARTNTGWWHDIVMKFEVRFVRGRPRFNDAKHGLPFPLAVVVFRRPANTKEVPITSHNSRVTQGAEAAHIAEAATS
jgi:phage N-6-adenine-methyltransferase